MRKADFKIYFYILFFLHSVCSLAAGGNYSIAVLNSDKCSEELKSALNVNFKANLISYENFDSIKTYDCLVISDEVRLSESQRKTLLSFLKSGNDLILLGAKDINLPQLPIFEDRDVYQYKDAKTATAYKHQDILNTNIQIKGTFSGLSAVAFEYPEVSRFIPVLAVEDKYCRHAGFACGVLINYAGKFKNSSWVVFGVENAEFYKAAEFSNILIEIINKIKDGNLAKQLKKQDIADQKKCLSINSPAPENFMKLSSDGKHFILPDGKKFFALGCNYIGPFERKTEYGEDYYNVKRLEQDFQKAKEAGINSFRFWNVRIDQYPERFKTIIELARKYEIYLILQPREHPLPTDKQLLKIFRRNAAVVNNETIVLGYDLMNEPYITMIGSVDAKGKQSEILKHKVYENYSDEYFDKKWVESVYENPGWPELGKWKKSKDAKNLYAAHSMAKRYFEKYNPSSDYSCLYGIDGKLPVEPEYKDFISAVDDTFAYWIYSHQQAVREFDKKHFFTVGYNTSLAALPCNAMLDFTNQHIYQMPYSYEDMNKAVTTFDRLRALWPNKPVMLGEFGFSSGIKMPDGNMLGIDAASVGEMMIYLYAFANDYSGAYLWMLSEWPVANIKYNAPWISEERQTYESRFGMYYYDGTEYGNPKPIAYATKFFSEYMQTHNSGDGSIDIIHADTPMKTGYIFTDKDAMFVGNTKFDSSQLKFYSPLPVNVMLLWSADKLKIMATADTEVWIDITQFGFSKDCKFNLNGNYDSQARSGDAYKINLLKGQVVTFFAEGNK